MQVLLIEVLDPYIQSSHVTEFTVGGQSFLIALIVLSVVCAVVGGVYSGLKVNGFLRRTGLTCCDIHVSNKLQ